MINPQIIKKELSTKFTKEELKNTDDKVIEFLEEKGIRTYFLKFRLIEMALSI